MSGLVMEGRLFCQAGKLGDTGGGGEVVKSGIGATSATTGRKGRKRSVLFG
jgi:hypothetical protein